MSSTWIAQSAHEGPWPKGQYKLIPDAPDDDNIIDDTYVYEDGGLTVLKNLLVSERGTLYARPGIWKAFPSTNLDLTGATAARILGTTKIFNTAGHYIVGISKSGANNRVALVTDFDASLTGYNDFGATAPYQAAFDYIDKVYIIPGPSASPPTLGTGQSYNGSSWSAVNMPGGRDALIWKNRAFVCDGAYLWWSKATDPTTWAAPDGGFVRLDKMTQYIGMYLIQDVLYIVGGNEIVTVTFGSDPAIDGVVRTLIDNVSILGSAVCNGVIYVLADNGLCRIGNGFLIPVFKDKIELAGNYSYGFSFTGALASVGDYLIFTTGMESILLTGSVVGKINSWMLNTRTGALTRLVHPIAELTVANTMKSSASINGKTLLMVVEDYGAVPFKFDFFKMVFTNEIPKTIDTNFSGTLFSPRYQLTSRRIFLGNPYEYKLLRWIGSYIKATQDALDGAVTLKVSKYNLDNDFVDDSNNPVLTGFDKTGITSQRLTSMIIDITKLQTQLTGRTLDQYGKINTGAYLTFQVAPFYLQYSSEAGQVAQ